MTPLLLERVPADDTDVVRSVAAQHGEIYEPMGRVDDCLAGLSARSGSKETTADALSALGTQLGAPCRDMPWRAFSGDKVWLFSGSSGRT